MEDLKEELTTIYHDNYSEEEFVKEMATFIRQREKDLQSEIEDKVWKVLKNARINPKDELWFMDVNDEILKELSNE